MLADAIKSICWERISGYAALKTKCDFEQYREISELTSMPARQVLIWTLYGSPLDVPSSESGPLTPQDKFFRDQQSAFKVRIVVFSTPAQARRYAAIRRHIDFGAWVNPLYRVFRRLPKMVERVKSFEAACRGSGKLYFTHVGLIANEIGHYFSKLSVAFVSDNGEKVYCVSSAFAASRQGEVKDIRDVLFFELSDADYPGAEGRKHYNRLFRQLLAHRGSWYFEDPSEVAARSTWRGYFRNKPKLWKEQLRHMRETLKNEHSWFGYISRLLSVWGLIIWIGFSTIKTIMSIWSTVHH
jgi:hypothetical protein